LARDPAAFPGTEGRIVYVDDAMDGTPVIASMAKDGTDPRQLTTTAQSPYGDSEPAWSPGGRFIVFTRNAAGYFGEIWRMNADGSGQKRLTNSPTITDFDASWSSDGSRIAFVSFPADHAVISTMDLNGGSVKRITPTTSDNGMPAWSPDNTKIAFNSNRRGTLEIYTMKADGTAVTRETDGLAAGSMDFGPDWSADGLRLSFTRGVGADIHVNTLNVATNVATPLTSGDNSDQYSAYSPDVAMDRVIFGSWDYDLLAADVWLWDGGTTTNLTGALEGNQDSPDWQPIPAFPLVDARFSTFKLGIEWVYGQGITVGCSAERYCPDDAVTRGQMATFLVRALNLPATSTDYFTDDETSSHEASINRVRAAGITSGCTATTYCPEAIVTREQMATFLAKGFNLPVTATDYFTDDETSSHEANINKVRAAGITSGCTATTYCPKADVTRGQMAAFLRRALE
jgi:hypothetical protein